MKTHSHEEFVLSAINQSSLSISHYNSFSTDDKLKFNKLTEAMRDNVFKIKLKYTIPAFILIDKDKIESFFGFQKGGSEYFFMVFR